MEGTAHRQGHGPLTAQLSRHGRHGLGGSREHHLALAVVISDHHPLMGLNQGLEFGPLEAQDRGHGTTAGGGHPLAAGADQAESRGCIEHAGGVEGHQFTEAVARHQRRAAALAAQAVHQQRLDHEQGGLGVAGVVQVGGAGAALRGFSGADGQQIAADQLGGCAEPLPGTRKVEHRGGHADFLRSLSGEYPGNAHSSPHGVWPGD